MSMPLVQVYSRPAVCFKEILRPPMMPRLRLLRLSVTDLCNFRCRYVRSAPQVENTGWGGRSTGVPSLHCRQGSAAFHG
jgi:hypothetical protein